MPELKYKRILLKVSGEALAGDAHRGLDFTIVNELCESIKTCVDMGVQIGLVIGAGNFWRGVWPVWLLCSEAVNPGKVPSSGSGESVLSVPTKTR